MDKDQTSAALLSHPCPTERHEGGFLLLDGEWEYGELSRRRFGRVEPQEIQRFKTQNIRVPFAPGTEMSGVAKKPRGAFFYHKVVHFPFRRARLRFLAVDYACRVFVNGKFAGAHTGGYTPFSFLVSPQDGRIEIVLFGIDSPSLYQVRGKQAPYFPILVMYDSVEGIWQSVYLEEVGDNFLETLHFLPFRNEVVVNGRRAQGGPGATLHLSFSTGQEVEVRLPERRSFRFSLPADFPVWSPAEPQLVQVRAVLKENRQAQDTLHTYFGYRVVDTREGKVWLNGKPIFQNLLLVQGYFSGGWMTGTLEQLKRDVQQIKAAGYNGLRMHQKIEDPRFLTLCDVEGLLVWGEMPSFYRYHCRRSAQPFFQQWQELLDRDRNHPAILVWVPFNESWGVQSLVWNRQVRKFVEGVVRWTRKKDPSRLIVDNSGFDHIDTDILDLHQYLPNRARLVAYLHALFQPSFYRFSWLRTLLPYLSTRIVHSVAAPGFKYKEQPIVVSEYGGFGYYKLKGYNEVMAAVREFTLLQVEHPLIQGLCYTQAYDVGQEKNGLWTFDRKPKFSLKKIRMLSEEVKARLAKKGEHAATFS